MKAIVVKKEDLVVGARIGYLTITSLRPFKQRCACGQDTSWTKTAVIRNGVRSCGCMRKTGMSKVVRVSPGETYGIYTVIEKDDLPRRWIVECQRCKRQFSTLENNFLYNKAKRCKSCD